MLVFNRIFEVFCLKVRLHFFVAENLVRNPEL